MTFAQMVTQVSDYCNLTSTEAQTRIGKSINRHYRRITSELGLDATRFVTRSVAMTIGVRSVTFTNIEKIDAIYDVTDSTAIRELKNVLQHTQRGTQPGESAPSTWSLQNTDADSVTVLTDTVPAVAYSLQADGWVTLADLSGTDEPIFPESFHDVLSWFVIAEELLKKEKDKFAKIYEIKAEKLLSELRFFLADSPTLSVRPRNATASTLLGSGGGSGFDGTTDLVIAKIEPRLILDYTGATTKSRVLTAVADYASFTVNADYSGGDWTKDDPAKEGYVLQVGTLTGVGFYKLGPIAGGTTGLWGVDNAGRMALLSGQISFPATQNPSADPNTLDDYEEGSFTPVLSASGGGSGQTYSNQVGRYIKIGKLVQCLVSIQASSLGTLSGDIYVSGLPFTASAATAHGGGILHLNLATPVAAMNWRVGAGSNLVEPYYTAAGGATGSTAVGVSMCSATVAFHTTVSYEAAA